MIKKSFVQVKLSVVDKEKVEVIVPRISEYANTQNKVNVADFFSNHPFHVRIEEFSRRLYAPSKEGTTIQTHWFYERARGQYANKQANLSKSKKKTFVTQNPRSQMFTKTDLAKFILSFDQLPYIVSRGAQKAFAGGPGIQGLVQKISKLWDKESSRLELNELWFKRSIAKAILFKGLDRGIFRAQWYSGYKSQIVTYSIAKFMNLLEKKSSNFDFIKIWELQEIPQDLLYELLMVAEAINDQFNDRPPTVTSNLGEWAKQERCWQTMQELEISLGGLH
jgi:predicted transcriptional regulator